MISGPSDQTELESRPEEVTHRRGSLLVHWLAIAALIASTALTAVLFVLLTPFDDLRPGLRQRDDDAVLVIRTFATGAVALGFLSAFLAATSRSFGRRPKSSIAIFAVAAVVALAAIYRIFQTIGI